MSEYVNFMIKWKGELSDLQRVLDYDPDDEDCVYLDHIGGNMYEYTHNESGMDWHRELLEHLYHHPLCENVYTDYRYLPDKEKSKWDDLDLFKLHLSDTFNCDIDPSRDGNHRDNKVWDFVTLSPNDELNVVDYNFHTHNIAFRDDSTVITVWGDGNTQKYECFNNGYQYVFDYIKKHIII